MAMFTWGYSAVGLETNVMFGPNTIYLPNVSNWVWSALTSSVVLWWLCIRVWGVGTWTDQVQCFWPVQVTRSVGQSLTVNVSIPTTRVQQAGTPSNVFFSYVFILRWNVLNKILFQISFIEGLRSIYDTCNMITCTNETQ